MNVTLPESLKGFVEEQVRSGRYKDADIFVAELVRTEADLCNRIARGDSIPVDEHFARRIASLLDEAEQSGDYVDVCADDFDAMEREAQQLAHNRKYIAIERLFHARQDYQRVLQQVLLPR